VGEEELYVSKKKNREAFLRNIHRGEGKKKKRKSTIEKKKRGSFTVGKNPTSADREEARESAFTVVKDDFEKKEKMEKKRFGRKTGPSGGGERGPDPLKREGGTDR